MIAILLAISLTACFGKRSQKVPSATQASGGQEAVPGSPTPGGIENLEATAQTGEAAQDEPGDRGEPAIEDETPFPTETGEIRRTRGQATPAPTLPAFRPASPTPTPAKPLLAATPFAYPGHEISNANISRLVELARWGKGEIFQMLWSPDGSLLAVAFSTGIYFYDSVSLQQVGWIDAKTDSFSELAFSPDGDLLAVGFIKQTTRVWVVPDGELLQSFPELRWNLGNQLTFTPDGAFLIVTGVREVTIWRVADRSLVLQTTVSNGSSALSPDGSTLVVANEDKLTFYEVSGGNTRFSLELSGRLSSLAYTPDGNSLAMALYDSPGLDWTVQTISTRDGSLMQSLTPGRYDLSEGDKSWKDQLWLAFTPDGASLAISSIEHRFVEVWRTADWKPVLEIQDEYYTFSPDSTRLASWSYDDPTLRVWRTTDGTQAYSISNHAFSVSRVIFSPAGEILATVDGTKILRLWDARNGREIRMVGEVANGRGQIAFSPGKESADLEPVIVAIDKDEILALWRATDGQLIDQLESPASVVKHLAFTPDGEFLSYQSQDGAGCLLRTADGSSETCFPVEENKLVQAISPEGATAFAIQDGLPVERGNPFWLLNATDPDIQIKLTLPFSITLSTFSRDGKTLFLASPHGEIVEYRTLDGSPVQRFSLALEQAGLEQAKIENLILSPDGENFVSTSSEGTIDIWRVSDGSRQTRMEMQITDPESGFVVFSSSGLLAISTRDQPIGIYSVADGSLLQEIESDNGYSRYICFLPGDEVLAIGSQKRVKFWQISTSRLLGSVQTQAWITSLAVSPDGRLLAIATEDGLIQIWGVNPED